MAEHKASGVDLASAVKALEGTAVSPLDVDWLAVDRDGALAIFLGDGTQTPAGADVAGTSRLIESVLALYRRGGAGGASYRSAGRTIAGEPVFDLPRASPNEPLHEPPSSGYPHLLFATEEGAFAVRAAMLMCGGHEVLSRGGFAVVLDMLDESTREDLHDEEACAGCRVLGLADDPHPRAPEMLATLGFHVYRFAGGGWIRIASPTVAADASDLLPIGGESVARVTFDGRFDDAPTIASI